MNYKIIPVTAFVQNCSIIWCNETQQAAIVDPGGEADKIIALADAQQVSVMHILLTHGHIDHAGAAAELAAHYGIGITGPHKQDTFWLRQLPAQGQLFGVAPSAALTPNRWLEEGEVVQLGNRMLEVLHCPGHTPGHVVFFDRDGRLLISGDVIFNQGIGRTDFPQGDHQALIRSIRSKLLPLGDDVTFIPGHGPISTLGHERLHNPFLQ